MASAFKWVGGDFLTKDTPLNGSTPGMQQLSAAVHGNVVMMLKGVSWSSLILYGDTGDRLLFLEHDGIC